MAPSVSSIVGPFTVEDADLLGQAQAAANAIPAAIAGADPPGTYHVWSSKRFGAPAWAYGYTPGGTNGWLNPKRHVAAHEFAHAFWARHGRQLGGDAALRALVDHPELIGKVENQHYTNRLSEAYAHAFAAAVGYPDGVRESFFAVKIPPGNYPALLALMSKAQAGQFRPIPTLRPTQRVALRALPQVDSPVLAWAERGDVIRAAVGRSGGPYAIPGAGDGSQSRAWLVVLLLNGHQLPAPAYTAALLWLPVTAQLR